MSETPLSERRAGLLAVIAEGGGDWDARRAGLTADARYGPGREPSCGNWKNSSSWGWLSGTTAGQVPGAGGR